MPCSSAPKKLMQLSVSKRSWTFQRRLSGAKRVLAVIRAAKARLEARQREADTARGRSPGDERRPRHPDGNPKRARKYKRDFGVPADETRRALPIRPAAS